MSKKEEFSGCPYRIMDTRRLFILSKKAWDHRYNRAPTKEFLKDSVDREGLHLVSYAIPHNDMSEIRCKILVKVNDTMVPAEVFLDVSLEDFGKLEVYNG